MREFFHGKLFKIILVILALLLGFMIYAVSQKGAGTVTSQIVGTIAAPFQQLSSYLSETATAFFGKFVNADEYYRQNEELREEIAKLRKDLVDYEETKRLNVQLAEMVGLKENNVKMETVAAMVVGRDPSEQFGDFTIDKGAAHGIHYRDVVVTGEGMVGVVTEVGEVYAKVTTILNPSLVVGAIEQRTGEIGTIVGTISLAEENRCKLSNLNETSEIKKGDTIVTSGVGGLYPKGLILGIAGTVETEAHGITSYTTVTPVFDIKQVKQVLVVTDFFGKSQDGED